MQRTGHIIQRCGSRQVASERNRYPHRSSPSLFPIASVMKSKSELAALRKRALAIASVNLALGFRAMLFSLGEKSVGWTLFVWFAGLEGISIGLLGGRLFSGHARNNSDRLEDATLGWILLVCSHVLSSDRRNVCIRPHAVHDLT